MMFINFLRLDDVLKMHKAQIITFGGAEGIRDHAGLAAAVAQPQQTWDGEFVYTSILIWHLFMLFT